jgi:hypothetical protein
MGAEDVVVRGVKEALSGKAMDLNVQVFQALSARSSTAHTQEKHNREPSIHRIPSGDF